MKKNAVLSVLVLAAMLALTAVVAMATGPVTQIYLHAGSLTGYSANSAERGFVINQLSGADQAPTSITVTLGTGTATIIQVIPLTGEVTGGVAHYNTNLNLDKPVITGTTYIDVAWLGTNGQFNYSHGPKFATAVKWSSFTATPVPENGLIAIWQEFWRRLGW